MDNRVKKLPEIRQNLSDAEMWLREARRPLCGLANAPLSVVKQYVQEAKKLIDEVVVDLDGLIQDAKSPEANGIDPEYEAWIASRGGR